MDKCTKFYPNVYTFIPHFAGSSDIQDLFFGFFVNSSIEYICTRAHTHIHMFFFFFIFLVFFGVCFVVLFCLVWFGLLLLGKIIF